MSEMVDAVAVAIFKALAGEPNCLISRVGADKAARAAIEAMREPTPEMLLAGAENTPDRIDMHYPWLAMIDAALGERE